MTESGAWSITGDGQNTPEVRGCVWSSGTCGSTSSGSGNATVRVYMDKTSLTIAVGTYARSITIDGQAISVTVNITAEPAPRYFSTTASPVCTYSDSNHLHPPYPDVCALDSQRPGGTYDLPAVGSSYTDSVFGTPLTVLANTYHEYSSVSLWTPDHLYVMLGRTSADSLAGIYSTVSHAKVAAHPATLGSYGNCQFWAPVGSSAYNIYCLTDNTVARIPFDPGTGLGTPVTIITLPTSGAISTGGSARPTEDGLLVVDQDKSGCVGTNCKIIYVLDLVAQTYSTAFDLTTLGWTINHRAEQILALDQNSGRYYVFAISQGGVPGAWLYYTRSANAMVYFSKGPSKPAVFAGQALTDCQDDGYYCYDGGHAASLHLPTRGAFLWEFNPTMETAGIWAPGPGPTTFGDYLGSGGSYTYSLAVAGHFTPATSLPLAAVGRDHDVYVDAAHIASIDNGTGTLHIDAPDGGDLPTFSPSDSVIVGCEHGNAGTQTLAGTYTVDSVGSGTVTLTGLTYTGTYSGLCGIALNTTPSGLNENEEGQIVRYDDQGRPMQIYRAAKFRSVGFSNGLAGGSSTYWSEPHMTLSSDGAMFGFSTNNGEPINIRFVVGVVPWQMRAPRENYFAPGYPIEVAPSTTSAVLKATSPTAADITCAVSEHPDFSSASTVTLSGPFLRSTTATGLTTGTQYYVECYTSGNAYVARTTFTTQ